MQRHHGDAGPSSDHTVDRRWPPRPHAGQHRPPLAADHDRHRQRRLVESVLPAPAAPGCDTRGPSSVFSSDATARRHRSTVDASPDRASVFARTHRSCVRSATISPRAEVTLQARDVPRIERRKNPPIVDAALHGRGQPRVLAAFKHVDPQPTSATAAAGTACRAGSRSPPPANPPHPARPSPRRTPATRPPTPGAPPAGSGVPRTRFADPSAWRNGNLLLSSRQPRQRRGEEPPVVGHHQAAGPDTGARKPPLETKSVSPNTTRRGAGPPAPAGAVTATARFVPRRGWTAERSAALAIRPPQAAVPSTRGARHGNHGASQAEHGQGRFPPELCTG